MMYSIGEFSKISGLTIKTIRYYHERGLLEPVAVDPQSGYRYYDDRNVESAFIIRSLRDLEFSLDDIVAILAEYGDGQDILEHLEHHKNTLAEKLLHYKNLVHAIDRLINQERITRQEHNMPNQTYEIEERLIEPLLVAGLRMKGKYSDCGQGFSQLGRQVGRYIAGKPMCLYYDGEFREEDADFEPCFPLRKETAVDGINVRTLPGTRCVTLIHHGPYESLGRTYAKLLKYVKECEYEISLPTREVYLKGPGMLFKGNPKYYLTEVQIPIDN